MTYPHDKMKSFCFQFEYKVSRQEDCSTFISIEIPPVRLNFLNVIILERNGEAIVRTSEQMLEKEEKGRKGGQEIMITYFSDYSFSLLIQKFQNLETILLPIIVMIKIIV